jgi:hypothetical protein
MMVSRTPSGSGSLVNFPLSVQTHYHMMDRRLGNFDGSPFRVKLRLKEGIEPQGRCPYRIPESYRPEMDKTIAKLLEFKLIEPSISHYSNPVFLGTQATIA